MIEALVGRDAAAELLDALKTSVHAPHLLDVEVLSGPARAHARASQLELHAAEQARIDYFALTIARYETQGLADRVWELRHNHTTYDACYLALAEALEALEALLFTPVTAGSTPVDAEPRCWCCPGLTKPRQ